MNHPLQIIIIIQLEFDGIGDTLDQLFFTVIMMG